MKFNLQRFAETWETANVATLKVDVNLTAAGNIAQEGDTVAGKKTITFKGLAASATPANANTVLDKIVGDICGGSYDSNSKNRSVSQGVEVSD